MAKALGIDLSCQDISKQVENVCARTSGNISSMLQDLRNGKPLEIEAITGVILREAASLGVPIPINQHLYDEIIRLGRTE